MAPTARTHNPSLQLAALLECDLAADLAKAQGARHATKVATEVVARHMDCYAVRGMIGVARGRALNSNNGNG